MLGAGKRNCHVSFQSPSVTQNTTNGEKTIGWATYGNKWACIEPVSARELVIAKSFSNTATLKVTILYDSNVKATWRFTYQGRVFSIDGINNPAGDKSEMELFCTEVIPKGT